MTTIRNKKFIISVTAIVLAFAVSFGGFALYVSDYYKADVAAIEAFASDDGISKTVLDDGAIAYGESNASCGFIFYPGGKVEHTAYEPLMRSLASEGTLCILIEMPFHLAVLDTNAADGIQELYPEIECWYIGGHSLGGSMAAYYAETHADDFEGLVLLGSYSSKDLSKTNLRVLSIYGSEDTVMDREKYEDCKANLPPFLTEIEIDGGCHAYFGMYGEQAGDGTPAITAEEQIRKASKYIAAFMTEGGN